MHASHREAVASPSCQVLTFGWRYIHGVEVFMLTSKISHIISVFLCKDPLGVSAVCAELQSLTVPAQPNSQADRWCMCLAGHGSFGCDGCIPDDVNQAQNIRDLYDIAKDTGGRQLLILPMIHLSTICKAPSLLLPVESSSHTALAACLLRGSKAHL